jgi:hypothetical protein
VVPVTTTPAAPAPAPATGADVPPASDGCAAALSYPAANAAPGFTLQCPGYVPTGTKR